MAPASILVSKKEAAALLNISVGMIEKLARQGILEPVRLGKRVLFRRDSIEELTLTPRQRRALREFDNNGTVQ
jgi:excisionase family DNA binding protein